MLAKNNTIDQLQQELKSQNQIFFALRLEKEKLDAEIENL